MASASNLSEGQKAPTFNLPSSAGDKRSLASLKGSWVVFYFYPKDDTPGCTVEAQQFRDHGADFEEAGAVVLGVSPDGVESHCTFRDKFDLSFELLADEDHSVAEKYGVWVEKNNYGRKYWGIQRATFLIDGTGKIARIWPKVKADGHAADVLEAIRTANSEG
jgi:peroxiredoxin Q/BCP